MKLLLYCTKAKPYLVDERKIRYHNFVLGDNSVLKSNEKDLVLNGKIVGECDYEVEEFDFMSFLLYENDVKKYNTEVRKLNEICKKSCLSATEMVFYLDTKALGTKNPNGMIGKAIHIKNLHIFDEPRELAHSTTDNDSYYYTEKYDKKFKTIRCGALIQAPKNMMYVYDRDGNKCILISIRPEHLIKKLNGECTIIVKKNVLKEML